MIVICHGMVRAGSTFQYNLVRGLLEKQGLGSGEGYIDLQQPRQIQELYSKWLDDPKWHAVKCHFVHPDLIVDAARGKVRIVYIYRDLRDVALSLRTMYQYESVAQTFATLDKAIQADEQLSACDNALRQRYETVMQNPEDAAREIAAFLQIPAADSVVREVVDEYGLEKMEKLTSKMRWMPHLRIRSFLAGLGFKTMNADKKSLVHANHISENRGREGAWRDILSAQEQELLHDKYGEWLRATDYDVTP